MRPKTRNWLTVTQNDVAHVARKIIKEANPYFFKIWSQAGQSGQLVLDAVAQTAIGMPKSKLMHTTGLSSDELEVALGQLEKGGLTETITISDLRCVRVQVPLTRRAFVKLGTYRP